MYSIIIDMLSAGRLRIDNSQKSILDLKIRNDLWSTVFCFFSLSSYHWSNIACLKY